MYEYEIRNGITERRFIRELGRNRNVYAMPGVTLPAGRMIRMRGKRSGGRLRTRIYCMESGLPEI